MIGAGRNLRVTHVITRLIVGGAQENTVSTVLGLQQNGGFDIDLVSGPPEPGQGSLAGAFASRQASLTFLPHLVRPVHPWMDFRALIDLRRLFRERQPAIVHTHSGKAGILGRWAAYMERVPVIVHGIHGPSFGPWQGPLANFLFRSLERAAGRVTTHFVAVAHAMIRQYLAAGIGTPSQYTRILSGFPLAPFLESKNDPQLRAHYGIGTDDVVIGKIARFFKLKGYEDLFALLPHLLEKHPNTRFLLIGGGPLEADFKKRSIADPRLNGKVIFTGLVPPEQIPALTGIMDILVHLSRREGLPRALPQALAAGKPVVAYDCDGAGEVCIDGQTGILVPPGNRAALLRALSSLVLDPAFRGKLGASGRKLVREQFPVERMVAATGQLYDRLLAERGLPLDPHKV